MPQHFVYATPKTDELSQGDVLRRTEGFVAALQPAFPLIAHGANRYFLVLTQSCDLVRRPGKPIGAQYISICPAVPLPQILASEAAKWQADWEQRSKIIDNEIHDRLILFTESLLDNNQPGYFYLHEDRSAGIDDRYVAVLANSVPMPMASYGVLLAAKVAQLQDNFQSKLGSLIGVMFNQVGTSEWDESYGKGAARREAAQLLKGEFIKFQRKQVDLAAQELKSVKPLDAYTSEEVIEQIKRTRVKPSIEIFSELADEILVSSPVCERLGGQFAGAIQSRHIVLEAVQKILAELNAGDPESLAKTIVGIVSREVQDISKDVAFAGRPALAKFSVIALRSDARLKRLF